MKKIEIILSKRTLSRLEEKLRNESIGYTILDVIGGYGPRSGEMNTIDLADGTKAMCFIVCDNQRYTEVEMIVRPYLKELGAFACVSDTQRIV